MSSLLKKRYRNALADIKLTQIKILIKRRYKMVTLAQKKYTKDDYEITNEYPKCGEELEGIERIRMMFIEVNGKIVAHCRDCACEIIHDRIMRDQKGELVRTVENMEKLFFSIERSHYVTYLAQYFRFIVHNCFKVFGEIWIDSEGIHNNLYVWKRCFKYIKDNKIIIMDDEDKKIYDNLPDEVTIYRGSVYEDGISWTLSKEKAEWFRDRFDEKDSKVFEKTIQKKDIIAYFNGRDEQEIIFLNGVT